MADDPRRYRIFCPRCGYQHTAILYPQSMRLVIDQPCTRCHQHGVDAVDLDLQYVKS